MEHAPFTSRRVSSNSTCASSFIDLQKQSRTLYGALKSKFSCSCNTQHRCGISAKWDKYNKAPSLNILIDDREGRKQVRWKVEAADRAVPSTPTDDQHSLNQIYQLDLQAHLLRQMEDDYLRVFKDFKPAALAFSSFAVVNNLSNTATENKGASWVNSLTGPVKRFNSVTKGASNPFSGQTQTAEAQGSQTRLLQPTQKRVQTIRPVPRPTPTNEKPKITNICSFIKSPPTIHAPLGTIEADYHDITFYLDPLPQRHLLKAQRQTVEAFWCSTMDLSARLRAGLSVAITLLTLGTSAWIPRCWGRNDLFLMRYSLSSKSQAYNLGPYLDHSSLSFALKEEPMNADDHAVLALFSLGVLLLELHYRTPLESSPYWDKHCPNGLRNEYTDMAAAREWYEDLASDPALEEGLAEPVRRCIEASFSTSADMEDKDFLRDILETAVKPLEEFIDQWSGL